MRSVRAIKKEILRLTHRERLAATGHGAGCALMARSALQWALGDDGAPEPMVMAVMADEGARAFTKKRRPKTEKGAQR